MKESLLKLKMMLFLLSAAFIMGSCTVASSEPQQPALLSPTSVSATFGGVTISTASVGASGVFIETDNTVVIRGFSNPPDELSVPDGEVIIATPAGVTVNTISLSFSDLTGSDAGALSLTETVTVSSEGRSENTFKFRIDFVAGTPALVVINSGGFDGIENNRLSLAKDSTAETIAMLSPCTYYAPDITFMLGTNTASTNYRVAPATDPRPVISPYFDSTDAANNTNVETYQVTYETNTGSIMFGFSVVVQDCSTPQQVFTSADPNNPGTTAANPWIITDAATLQAMAYFVNQDSNVAAADDFFELANDVDLAGFGGPEGFTPIGISYHAIPGANDAADNRNFAGRLDCKGNTISNLTINRPSSDYQGLFAYITDEGGTPGFIRNCRLMNVNVVGRDGVGGLVGDATSDISISNVHLQGEVRGRTAVGGLIGRTDGTRVTRVENTSVHATVSGAFMVGGMIGFTRQASVVSSYFNGTVLGELVVGGLIGFGCDAGDCPAIRNVYARGTVTGFSAVGGLLGSADLPPAAPNITNTLSLMTLVSSNLEPAVIERYRTDSSSSPSFERLETFQYTSVSTPFITQFDATPSVTPMGAVIGGDSGLLTMTTSNHADSTLNEGLPLVFGVDAPAGFTASTTEQLQSATAPGAAASDPYHNWDAAVWDFGTATQYPVLKPPTDGVFTLEEQRTP
ncbi:hypothetical protein COTS27_01600 [Spirochaetota bacterium]|nr:hypothetical protein COTS27_01600 [Spirochaetota bacterium]